MALPKSDKYDVNITPTSQYIQRRIELLLNSDDKTTYLPKSITLEDLDASVFDFFENGQAEFYLDGDKIPVLMLPNERWAEVERTWKYADNDTNVRKTFITLKRTSAPKKSEKYGLKYTVPQSKLFSYVHVPNTDGTNLFYDVYMIPQPKWVDLEYELTFVTKLMSVANEYDSLMINLFSNQQVYLQSGKRYFPLILESSEDTSVLDDFNDEKIIIRKHNFLFTGCLIDENDFQKKKSIRVTPANIKFLT